VRAVLVWVGRREAIDVLPFLMSLGKWGYTPRRDSYPPGDRAFKNFTPAGIAPPFVGRKV
jgi:hypothetical protein